jgi:membrane protease subunit (stomatin/prohibitin family)
VALLGREFIAVPDDRKNQMVYKWPDVSIRRFSQAIVNADEQAYFVNTGQIAQPLGPGRHTIDADELPGLGIFIDAATAGRAYRAELYFIGTREFTGFTFGGRIDDVQDPQTGLIVTLRVFGDYAVRVVDPVKTVTNLVGTVDVSDNTKISAWVSDQLLKVMRTDITTQIVRNGWPILGLSAYTTEIEPEVIAKANEQLEPYGVAITKMGNFDINLSPEDTEQIKTLAKDTSYSRLAGSFNQYAAGEVQLGAGEGMSQGGAAVGGAFLGAGFGAVGGVNQMPVTAPPATGFAGGGAGFATAGAAPAGTGKFQCSNCHADNDPSSKFCASCGQPLVARVLHCTECGTELAAGVKFCANCGHPVAPPATE